MKVESAQQLLQMQMMNQIFKQALGDSDSFQLVMESLTKAMENGSSGFDLSSFQGQDLNNIGFDSLDTLNNLRAGLQSDMKTGNVSIDEAVDKASQKYGIDKDLIKAVIKQESSFDPYSTSSAGAQGLMQLMPGTAAELGVDNPYDIEENVDGGTRYLSSLLNMYGNSKEMALAAYNAGPGTVKSRGVSGSEDIYKMPSETRNYVKNVMKYYGK